MKFKIPPQWYIIKEFEYESNKVYKQVNNCVFSDIRADILILTMELNWFKQLYDIWKDNKECLDIQIKIRL